MAKKTLSEMSLEELNRSIASSKGILIGFALLWLIVIGVLIYVSITRSGSFPAKLPKLLPVFGATVPVMIPLFIHFSNIRKEVKKRQSHS